MSVMFEGLQSMLEENLTFSFPPGSQRLPVDFSQLFDVLVHWMAYLIACASVTVSLLICMTIVLFSCACVLEMLIEGFEHAVRYVREGYGMKFFGR